MGYEAPAYAIAAAAYGVLGIGLGLCYRLFPVVRDQACLHGLTVFLAVAGGAIVLGNPLPETTATGAVYHLGVRGYLFFAAALCHVPLAVWILLHYWNRFLERITAAHDHNGAPRRKPPRKLWQEVNDSLRVLARDPLDADRREKLADGYLELGLVRSAIREYLKAAECRTRGYHHARLLYKAARLMVQHGGELGPAIPILRRLIRLYPRSYFAAYARRIVNHFEARCDTGLEDKRR